MTKLMHLIKSMMFLVFTSMMNVMFAPVPAWAYKVEKICENIPATLNEPAQKKCRMVRVKEDEPAKKGSKENSKGDTKADANKKSGK